MTRLLEMIAAPERVETAEMARKIMTELNEQSKASQPALMGRDAGRIADEIVAHLTSLGGAKAKITLEIDIEVPNGIPEDRVRIINENGNTLKFKNQGFEDK